MAIPSERLTPVINATMAKLKDTNQLNDELSVANLNLEEQKLVERARGILMRQRNLDEDEAYSMLHEMAMKRNMKLVDLSSQLIEAAKMLIV